MTYGSLIGILIAGLLVGLGFGAIYFALKVPPADCSWYADYSYQNVPARCLSYFGMTGTPPLK